MEAQHHYPLNCPTGRWTLISTILASSMAFIDGSALNVILPTLQRDLGATGADLFWVLNSYMLMLAALIILGGSLGDRRGRVKIFKLGILIFSIGSILCGLAPDIQLLILCRFIQGIGGALMIPGSLAIISATFTAEEKGKAIGTWSAATVIVTICGPLLGGALADIGLWRFIFYLNLPLGLIAYIILQYKVPESREPGNAKVDWLGAITLTLSLALLSYGFLGMPEWGYTHPVIIITLSTGILFLIVFIWLETKVESPMIPLEIFKNKTFTGVNLLSFFLYAALGGVMLFLSLNVIQIQGYSQFQAGLMFLPFSILMIIAARIMGSLTDKYGARNFLILGPAVTALGMFLLSLIGMTEGPKDYWATYFVPFIVFASGMSITVVPLTTAVMASVDDSKSGIASGINNSVTRISGTFINAILGAFAVIFFSSFVTKKLGNELMNYEAAIMEEAFKLGEATAPANIPTALQGQVNHLFALSFVDTYQLVCVIGAVLAALSAVIAFFMVERK